MTPITTKDLGLDKETGLNKELQVWQLLIDTKSEKITVVYDIVLLSPTGLVVSVLETKTYYRYNYKGGIDGGGNKINDNLMFDYYRNSDLGKGIISLIEKTIADYPNVEQINL